MFYLLTGEETCVWNDNSLFRKFFIRLLCSYVSKYMLLTIIGTVLIKFDEHWGTFQRVPPYIKMF